MLRIASTIAALLTAIFTGLCYHRQRQAKALFNHIPALDYESYLLELAKVRQWFYLTPWNEWDKMIQEYPDCKFMTATWEDEASYCAWVHSFLKTKIAGAPDSSQQNKWCDQVFSQDGPFGTAFLNSVYTPKLRPLMHYFQEIFLLNWRKSYKDHVLRQIEGIEFSGKVDCRKAIIQYFDNLDRPSIGKLLAYDETHQTVQKMVDYLDGKKPQLVAEKEQQKALKQKIEQQLSVKLAAWNLAWKQSYVSNTFQQVKNLELPTEVKQAVIDTFAGLLDRQSLGKFIDENEIHQEVEKMVNNIYKNPQSIAEKEQQAALKKKIKSHWSEALKPWNSDPTAAHQVQKRIRPKGPSSVDDGWKFWPFFT